MDRVFSSRKFILALIAITLITVVSLLGTWIPGINTILSTYTTSILGVLGLYFTGNVVMGALGKQKLPEEEK